MVESGNLPGISGDNSPEILHPAGGTLFGKYEVGKLVGCGAFAKVYHARDTCAGRSVAIKAVSKRRLQQRGGGGGGGIETAHVKREIAIMHRLRHPQIVRLFEVLPTKTKIYFVMEFAKGGELFGRVSNGGRFSEDLSRRYFQQLISAVGYCHSRGVFHRDLKPENLLLDENLDLKITDFGLGAVTDQIRPDGLLHTLCGTPAYVAPEILANKGYDGAKIDVWSCGVVLFVLNAGYLPFNDPNVMVLYRKIYKGDFRVPKWTSPELRHLLGRLLDTNPVTRITVDEIIADPWFRKGFNEEMIRYRQKDFIPKHEKSITQRMNAFDIVSLSPGLDLSGLFGEFETKSDRFLSAETPPRIVKTIEDVAAEENLTVIREHVWRVKVEGLDGNFRMTIEIHRLTDELVVIEVKISQTAAVGGCNKWKDTIRSRLSGLIYKPVEPVPGELKDVGPEKKEK